jgi:hypothetical protein
MKLIVVMGIEEHREKLRQIFRDQKVPVHSELPIQGFTHQDAFDEAGNWFAVHHPAIDSQLFFTFVDDSKADALMNGIRAWCANEQLPNPIRAFQMNVEQHN